jgi:hypothetical protein
MSFTNRNIVASLEIHFTALFLGKKETIFYPSFSIVVET